MNCVPCAWAEPCTAPLVSDIAQLTRTSRRSVMTEPTPLLPRCPPSPWPSAAPSTSFGAWSGSRTPSARRSPTRREMLKLIASENYASPATLLTMGELVPATSTPRAPIGRRFYAGCRNVDTVEALAAEHARELFGAQHATSSRTRDRRQPRRLLGRLADRVEAPALERAVSAASTTCRTPTGQSCVEAFGNQRMLGMSLDAGGHLTHGCRPNISGRCSTSAAMAPTRPPQLDATRPCAPRPASSSR